MHVPIWKKRQGVEAVPLFTVGSLFSAPCWRILLEWKFSGIATGKFRWRRHRGSGIHYFAFTTHHNRRITHARRTASCALA